MGWMFPIRFFSEGWSAGFLTFARCTIKDNDGWTRWQNLTKGHQGSLKVYQGFFALIDPRRHRSHQGFLGFRHNLISDINCLLQSPISHQMCSSTIHLPLQASTYSFLVSSSIQISHNFLFHLPLPITQFKVGFDFANMI